MRNKRPALVAYCTGAADVRAAVAFGRDRDYPMVVRVGMGEDDAEVAYGESYDRFADVKAEYDPENVFWGHQNVGPNE